jgi:hypothetical protein
MQRSVKLLHLSGTRRTPGHCFLAEAKTRCGMITNVSSRKTITNVSTCLVEIACRLGDMLCHALVERPL